MTSQPLWWAVFSAASALLLALPLVPAFLEWLRPTDVAPLPITREHDGDIRRFAHALRARVEPFFPALADAKRQGENVAASLPDGDTILLVGAPEKLPGGPLEGLIPKAIVASQGDIRVASGSPPASGIFAGGDLLAGAGAVLRCAFAGGDIRLDKGVQVRRWIHAGGTLAAADGCRLNGRASADGDIELGIAVAFERLNAPTVRTGRGAPPEPRREEELSAFDPGGHALDLAGRSSLLIGDLEVPPGHAVETNIVVLGRLSLGAGTEVRGSIKARGHLEIGAGAAVTGAAVCAGDISIGPDAAVGGPLVAEGRLRLGEGSRVGSPASQTTVSARQIAVAPNVSVHGTLWAREWGMTEGVAT